jgi:hypothetical protein
MPVKFLGPDHARIAAFFQEADQRFDAFKRRFIREIAKECLVVLKRALPEGEFDLYRNAFSVRDIEPDREMDDDNIIAAGIYGEAKEENINDKDAVTTLLYFDLKGVTVPPWGGVYEQNEPWTMDQVPVIPDLEFYHIIYRNTTPDDVVARREQLIPIAKDVADLLFMNNVPLHWGLIGSGRPVYMDLGFKAVQTEFGLAGERYIDHWKLMVSMVPIIVRRVLSRDPKIRSRILEDGSYTMHDLRIEPNAVPTELMRESEEFVKMLIGA